MYISDLKGSSRHGLLLVKSIEAIARNIDTLLSTIKMASRIRDYYNPHCHSIQQEVVE